MKCSVKKALSLVLALALVLTSIVVPTGKAKKAEAASTYNACLVFQTSSYYCRDGLDSSNHGNVIKLQTKDVSGTGVKDAKLKKGKNTITVMVKGLNKCKFTDSETFNLLYVDTDIPQSMKKKVKFSNMVVKFDGKTVKTIAKPFVTDEDGADTLQAVAINNYNDDVTWKNVKVTAKKKITVTLTATIK